MYKRISGQPGWLRLLSGSPVHPFSPIGGPNLVGVVATINGCATTAVSSVADLETGPDCCERLTYAFA